ncbi:hypothetical protein [Entomomonas asaccharolytica]|uniref:DUF4124 domain-containing protein n=1 Tax=Entomomonas asaccharolytica TaxID=2785331 RepID=A0A974RYA1_9GAMM|nr:hypothetical protein [Entomomonas asaccharolytica]QQP87050.1 hypothetical protein JHT90_07350 [Entomomonas asaccharolytica]
MLQKVLLGLCIIPVLAHAEIACLEGPSGGKCQNVDIHGEIFKTSTPANTATPTTNKAVANTGTANKRVNFVIKPNQQKATTNKVNQQVANNDSRQMSIAEQRVRQRAQLMEQRFMGRQGVNNLSALNNNDSLTKRKQASADLRQSVEAQ